MLEHNTYLPVWAYISETKHHDQKIIETLDPVAGLVKGAFVFIDRGYNDYKMLDVWNDRKINFVCQAKDNIKYNVVKTCNVPNKVGRPSNSKEEEKEPQYHVISDEIIELATPKGQSSYPGHLRLVRNLDISPATIANIY
jgi:hypothetical protein